LMRANPIQMYDTAFIRMNLGGAIVNFIATHAGEQSGGINIRFEFENGTVSYSDGPEGTSRFAGTLNDGTKIDYGKPEGESEVPFWKVVASLRGENEDGLVCPAEAAVPHNRVMIASLLSAKIGGFLEIRDDGSRFYVDGLDEVCQACDRELILPAEKWARPGETISLDDPRIDSFGALN